MADAPEQNKASITKITPTSNRRWLLLVLIPVIVVICLLVILYLWRNDVFHKENPNTGDFSLFGIKNSLNNSTINCGNGVCEKDELISEKCAKDCGSPIQNNQVIKDAICGNGICDRDEIIDKTCPLDCG